MNKSFKPDLNAETVQGGAHVARPHDSAIKHVTGQAIYIDDMAEPAGTLHAYLGLSERAHAKVVSMNLDKVKAAPGVKLVLTGKDVPGINDISPAGLNDEPVLADGEVKFYCQPVFCVVAETRHLARKAAQLAEIEYEDLHYATDVVAAMEAGHDHVCPPLTLKRGDVDAGLAKAPHRLKGEMRVGG